jgi:hypothetical protein
MIHKILTTTCGSEIHIYQNLFTISQCDFFADFAINSKYQVGRFSSSASKLKPGNFFSCAFSDDDDERFGLTSTPQVKEIIGNVSKRLSWINATITGSWYFTHSDIHDNGSSDKEYLTLLFNINRFWDTEHGGETLFYNKHGEKELAVDFIPGQLIVFDSRLAHKPALSDGNTDPRFIFVSIFDKLK